MREVCQDFLGDIGDFQKIADSFIVIFDAVSKEVETEKMKVRRIIKNSEIHQYWMRFEISNEIKFNPKCVQPTITMICQSANKSVNFIIQLFFLSICI